MDEIQGEIQGVLERIAARKRAEMAELPCATCEVDGDCARGCKHLDHDGCKHVVELGRRRNADEQRRNRISNLAHAGFDRAQLAEDEHRDDPLQMVIHDRLEPWVAVHVVRHALTSHRLRFLVLGGPHRVGKSLAAIYACAQWPDSLYLPAQQLGRISQDTARWRSVQLLVLNELGREHLGNGYTASNLEELMAEREFGRKLTIITTNLPLRKKNAADAHEPPGLVERYGDLFASRIVKPIGAYQVCRAGPVEIEEDTPTVNNPVPFNERAEQ